VDILKPLKKFWNFLKEDTWQSWIVSLILMVVIIKFILFPGLSLVTGTSLPLVVVESCSMYHDSSFDKWWEQNSLWYTSNGITKEEFRSYTLKSGLNKGDIALIVGAKNYTEGDIIVFNADRQYPLIHRVVDTDPISTKGDNNPGQLDIEKEIEQEQIIGKAVFKIPYLGWIKLIFFEPLKPESLRGFC